jgi:hypothetical protein
MECPTCGYHRGYGRYTLAQARSIRAGRGTSSGGRDMCEDCWSSGPTEADVAEVEENLFLWFFGRDLHGTEMTDFMVVFARHVSSGENHRQIWSHHGMLYAWAANDPRTRFTWTRHPASPRDTAAGGQWTFDPTNRIYGKVTNEICPDLSARLGWQHAASDETCGDCIEALLGVWLHCAAPGWAPYHDEWRPTAHCVVLNRAARCWEQMSYRAYRIFRVLDWYRRTHVMRQGAGLRVYSAIVNGPLCKKPLAGQDHTTHLSDHHTSTTYHNRHDYYHNHEWQPQR